MERILAETNKLLLKKPYVLIAIDGRCASGKSTLANRLLWHYGEDAALFHMDDFFLPPEMRTAERLSQPGGNIHHERFLIEVLEPLKKGFAFRYDRYDCQTGGYAAVRAERKKVTIVEGVYALHPLLYPHYDLKVFVTLEKDLQLERLLIRGGPERTRRFVEEWIPMEEKYFRFFGIREQCDLVIEAR